MGNLFVLTNQKNIYRNVTPTGIDIYSKNEFLKIFPNPVSDKIYVAFKGVLSVNNEIRIYNTTGQEVMKTSVDRIDLIELDISYLKNGTYILKYFGNGKMSASQMFVKKE